MADIRVERKSGGRVWLWILLVLVLLIVAVFLLDRAGYIDLPVNVGSADATGGVMTQFAVTADANLQEG
ncbi:MAG TPA: hypothetical protein VFZ69_00400 [Longimicrobiales bacterium]